MKRLITILILILTVSFNITACGGNTISSKQEISTSIKQAINGEKLKECKVITKEGIESLKAELMFINEYNATNISVNTTFSGKDYNSLNKDFYDSQIIGLVGDKILKVELFLFTDENGRITDVGTWSRTIN